MPNQIPEFSRGSGVKSPAILICLAIAILTAVVYWRTGQNSFINFDDPDYVTANPMTQSGLTLQTVRWAFGSSHSSNWHPVTWLSHALDCQLFGLNLGAHHLESLGIHIGNALLLFLLLKRITGSLWRSAFVAALFAVHPLHVESVAWLSERKDVLSTLFFLLTLWSYASYTGRLQPPPALPPTGRFRGFSYGLALVWFALGLMSKPMLVTLPCVLLLLDFWPLGRMTQRATFGKLLIEKLPFFALAAASSAATFLVQRASGAVVPLASSSLETRAANALVAYGRYLGSTFVPVDLSVFYPYIPFDFSSGTVLGSGLLLVAISIGACYFARSRPWAFVGWFWFLGTLVPVIGLVQVGRQSMADRYTYLPHIGFFILFTWACAEALGRSKAGRAVCGALGSAAVLVCGWLTADQVPLWRNSTTLFTHAAKATQNNFIAHGVLANALLDADKLEEAGAEVEKSIQINPGYPEAHLTRGHIHAKKKEFEKAVSSFQEALQLDASFGDAYTSLADVLLKMGRFSEAEAAARAALRLGPLGLPAHYSLATALHQQKKYPEAIETYQKLISLNPGLFSPYRYMANAYFAMGKVDEAIASLQKALSVKPGDVETRLALGLACVESGHLDEGTAALEEVLRMQPHNAIAAYQVGMVRQSRKDYAAAVTFFRKALAEQPEWPEALNNLAWLLAACPRSEVRDGSQAVALAERAVKLTSSKEPMFLGTLAASFAEAGRYAEAVDAAGKARALAEAQGNKELARRNGELLELYRAGKAFHEAE